MLARPAFPAPSDFRGAMMTQNPGKRLPREGEGVCATLLSFRDAPSRQNSEQFCAEGAGPESIVQQNLRENGFRVRTWRCAPE